MTANATEKDTETQQPQRGNVSELKQLLSSAGFMHPSELERIAIRLGNGLWCRHWYHWGQTKEPWIMAVQIRAPSGTPVGCDDLKDYGFVRGDDCLYFINRANEDGTPYHESGR
jgi:hypothetical protein